MTPAFWFWLIWFLSLVFFAWSDFAVARRLLVGIRSGHHQPVFR